ncbi:MAG: nitronate monooxygenase, partial [Proteobacteria bacterium]|nr:nitronate monooxygenase [Pseudomonadota bacterium]
MWPDRRLIELFGIEHPIIQAPMAGSGKADLVVAVSEAGGLGSLGCAVMTAEEVRTQLGIIRQRTAKPINVNFFTHKAPAGADGRERGWRQRLAPYYAELGLDPASAPSGAGRAPFDNAYCELMTELKPKVVSFHFGLPETALLKRVKDAGSIVVASATTVEEAHWLEDNGVDAVVAQGFEAGGHRGMFLTEDLTSQAGTMALVPQIVDAVRLPVIAAGGIGDARGIAAAFMLGAAGVQLGTAYLFCPESTISPLHRAALKAGREDRTALTNVFTGRPARGL